MANFDDGYLTIFTGTSQKYGHNQSKMIFEYD